MNISKAKEQVKGAVRAYLTKDDLGLLKHKEHCFVSFE